MASVEDMVLFLPAWLTFQQQTSQPAARVVLFMGWLGFKESRGVFLLSLFVSSA